jgi:hypothetical protein
MTIEAVHSTSRTEKFDSTAWVPVATGLWAGNTAGNFIGLIEKVSTHGYIARNGRSEPVGLYSSLAEAKRAVERS